MTDLVEGQGWAIQQLAGLLADISRHDSEQAMVEAAGHRIAEAVDAEVCALVTEAGSVLVAIGFPNGTEPIEQLGPIIRNGAGKIDLDGLGPVEATVVAVTNEPGTNFVLARTSDPLTAGEIHLVRSMAQVVGLALELRRTADRERVLRLRSEEQAADLQRAHDQLLDASEAKDMFIAVASHELRTPLTSILGFAGTLRQHHDRLEPEQRMSYLDIVERQGKRLLRLIDDLLTVGRLDAGQLDPVPVIVDVLQAMGSLALEHAPGVEVLGDASLTAFVDPDHLDQILLNLLTNAQKYGDQPIRLLASGDDRSVQITVEDAGDGVPESFVPQLFDRFSQASTGENRESRGAGLGLAIVAGLCDANGATIRHERVDGRTRFVVHLPSRSPC